MHPMTDAVLKYLMGPRVRVVNSSGGFLLNCLENAYFVCLRCYCHGGGNRW